MDDFCGLRNLDYFLTLSITKFESSLTVLEFKNHTFEHEMIQ